MDGAKDCASSVFIIVQTHSVLLVIILCPFATSLAVSSGECRNAAPTESLELFSFVR